MDPTTDIGLESPLTIEEFYDALATDYDSMTGFQKRFVQEKPFFRLLVDRHRIRTALDVGCGTGFHSLLLAQLGVEATGIDVSPAMIREAQRHAQELSLTVTFIEANGGNMNSLAPSSFDAVFSMGNTMSHLLSDEELHATLRNMHAVLKPGGIVLLQNLNYDRILVTRQRLQSIKESGNATYVRFYDYEEDFVLFTILTIGRGEGIVRQSMKTVRLRPLVARQWETLLQQSGFENIRLSGGIALDSFDRQTSKDLVIVAQKRNTT